MKRLDECVHSAQMQIPVMYEIVFRTRKLETQRQNEILGIKQQTMQ